MKINLRIFKALFKKDFKNCFINKNVLLMLILPIMFCFIYKMIFSDMQDVPAGYITIMCITLSLSVIPLNILASMVAEEKEKHTMRSLMLANVSASDFLLSKAAVSFVLILVDSVIIFFISQEPIHLLGYFILFIMIVSFGLLFFGALVGIIAKDQMNAGTISSPLMILLMLPTMFSQMNEFFAKIAVFFPTTSFKTLYTSVMNHQSLFTNDGFIAMLVCFGWIVVGLISFSLIYKKKGLDD